jgi:hypothetical protein
VGLEAREIERAESYAAHRRYEQLIAAQIRRAELKPLQRIGFDGQPRSIEELPHPDEPKAWARRNTSASPLEYLRWQSKAPLADWEYLTGKRFEHDWAIAYHNGQLTMPLERVMQIRREHEPRRRPGQAPRVVTFKPRFAKRQARGPIEAMSDARIDALARLGILMACVSNVTFFMLREVIGHERWLKDVAAQMGVSQEYAAQRFREALCDAALHYADEPSRKPRRGK